MIKVLTYIVNKSLSRSNPYAKNVDVPLTPKYWTTDVEKRI